MSNQKDLCKVCQDAGYQDRHGDYYCYEHRKYGVWGFADAWNEHPCWDCGRLTAGGGYCSQCMGFGVYSE